MSEISLGLKPGWTKGLFDSIKDGYKHIFYDPIKDRIVLVSCRWTADDLKHEYLECAVDGFYGKNIRIDSAQYWIGLGKV